MNTQLAASIDPIFEHVIVLLEKAENNQQLDPQAEKQKILEKFASADIALGRSPDWQLGRFALVAWIDEMLIYGSGWPDSSRSWWHSNMLELDLFPVDSGDQTESGTEIIVIDPDGADVSGNDTVNTNDFKGIADREFFHRAAQAAELPSRDALEVYYLAVILGFRGIYRHGDLDPAVTSLPRQLGVWLRKTSTLIQVGQQLPQIPAQTRRAVGALLLPGRFQFLAAMIWMIIFLSAAVVALTLRLKVTGTN